MKPLVWAAAAASALALGAAPAAAVETISYSYDARGRLVQAARTGSVNEGVTTSYAYDKTDNRTSKTTTGVTCLIPVPLGGITLVPVVHCGA